MRDGVDEGMERGREVWREGRPRGEEGRASEGGEGGKEASRRGAWMCWAGG